MKVFFLIVLTFICSILPAQVKYDVPGYSLGFSWSGLQYGAQGNNDLLSFPAGFKAMVRDDNGYLVKGDFTVEKKNICKGFAANWEFMLFRFPNKKIFHGPSVLVSYQKCEDFGSDMWGFGYFFRYKPVSTSATGFSGGFHFFPKHNFKRQMNNVNTGDSINFYFDGNNFGDTVSVFYWEKKMSLCPEMTFHLAIGKTLELRFSAGYFLCLKSVPQIRIESELNEYRHTSTELYSANGNVLVKQPVFNTNSLFMKLGIYMHFFTPKEDKKK